MTDADPTPKRSRRIAMFLWLLPLWLVVSSGAGIWLHLRGKAAAEKVEQARMATGISADLLRDDMAKVLGFVGERHVGSTAGTRGLTRMASMIEGTLGPGNAGYLIDKAGGPESPAGSWPVLAVTLRGADEAAPPLWVLAGYDARPGSPGAEANASGVTSVLAAAQSLAAGRPARSVRFVFLPHAYDPESPFMEMLERFARQAAGASAILVVEATGAGERLVVSSRDAGNPALSRTDGLGEIAGAEAICLEDDFDLSSILFELGLPAARISSRPVVRADEDDAAAPSPELHAAATRSLVTLIERLSGM